jgi:lipopolysaccharide/colanic/teichoic acid biosynthesis glycosyltransferase
VSPARVEAGQRALDLILGATLLVILLPVLAAISLAVKMTSRGPLLHRAEVVGRSGDRFSWHKFRTMRVDAGETPHREAARRFITGTDSDFRQAGVFKIQTDDRVTAVGALLRRHSLDELPQLLDVMAGRMSLVGPRPCLPYEWEIYAPRHRRRLDVKPGMTGLWQVMGRSRVDFEEMVLLDRCWGWNRSIGLYLGTLARTARVVLRGEGGY